MKRLLWIIAIVLFAAGFSSCEKYVIPPSEDIYISYSASIEPILESDCVSCHEDRAPILTPAEAYNELMPFVNIADPESSSLITKLDGSHATRTSANNKIIILDWIKAGAPND
jgi:hypothetical protein